MIRHASLRIVGYTGCYVALVYGYILNAVTAPWVAGVLGRNIHGCLTVAMRWAYLLRVFVITIQGPGVIENRVLISPYGLPGTWPLEEMGTND